MAVFEGIKQITFGGNTYKLAGGSDGGASGGTIDVGFYTYTGYSRVPKKWAVDDLQFKSASTISASTVMVGDSRLRFVHGDSGVLAIDAFALAYCASLSSVTFDGCTFVGYGAFYNDSRLSSVDLPECIRIDDGILYKWYNSTYGSITSLYSTFGAFTFTLLSHVDLPKCEHVGSYAFCRCTNLSTISLPSCSYIGDLAFYGCGRLSSVYAPNVKHLGGGAFCPYSSTSYLSLSNIDELFPELETIGDMPKIATGTYGYQSFPVFGYFSQPTSLSFPKLTSIGFGAFDMCSNLVSFTADLLTTVADGATGYYEGLGGVFRGTGLSVAHFPNLIKVGYGMFNGCGSLSSAYLPECQAVGGTGFYACVSLKSISLPKCTSVTYWAFGQCSSLSHAYLPTCLSLGMSVFAGCINLSHIDLSSCETIGVSAFNLCSSLMTIDLPSCRIIESSAFRGCTKLASVSLPMCTSIGIGAFTSTKIAALSLPSCNTIDAEAFMACASLSTVYLGSCSTIAARAFSYCSKLQSLYLMGSKVPTLTSSDIFMNTPLTNSNFIGWGSIFVPPSLLSSYKKATYWSTMSYRMVAYTG